MTRRGVFYLELLVGLAMTTSRPAHPASRSSRFQPGFDRWAVGGAGIGACVRQRTRPAARNTPFAQGPAMLLQEQMGLKLETTKGPVETIVIDHIERPSGN